MQYKYLVVLAILTAVLNTSCGSSKHSSSTSKLTGNWQAQPIDIDGDSKDWPSPYPNYDSKGMVAYATANDKDNLYVTVETGDEQTQTKILKSGMTVWIDTSGNKEQDAAIHYPLPNDNITEGETREHTGGNGMSDIRAKQHLQNMNKALSEANQFTVEGFTLCNGGFAVTQKNPCGIKVRMSIDEYGELVWEAAIPFKAIYNKAQITAADAGKPIGVCFAIKGIKKPAQNGGNNSNQGTGMNTNAMAHGGGGGGGMHGGRGGGGRGQSIFNDNLYESTRTWKEFGLAYQQ